MRKMRKVRLLIQWVIGMLAVLVIAVLAGYISYVLDFFVSFAGGVCVTIWALRRFEKL